MTHCCVHSKYYNTIKHRFCYNKPYPELVEYYSQHVQLCKNLPDFNFFIKFWLNFVLPINVKCRSNFTTLITMHLAELFGWF